MSQGEHCSLRPATSSMNNDLYRKISSVWYYGLDLIWQSQDSFHPWNFLWINLWYFQSKPQLLGPSHLFQNTTLNTPLISRKYHFVTPVQCTFPLTNPSGTSRTTSDPPEIITKIYKPLGYIHPLGDIYTPWEIYIPLFGSYLHPCSGISETERQKRRQSNSLSTKINFLAWIIEVES